MNVIEILPEYLYKFHYDENDSLKDFLNEAWSKEEFKTYRKHESRPVFTDNFSLPIEWKNFLLKSIRSVISSYPLYSYDFFLGNVWAVNLNDNNGLPRHRHKNSLFSGVYYLQVKPPNNRIVFSEEDIGAKQDTQEIKDGDLLIWESHLIHEIPQFVIIDDDYDMRISLAFDVLFYEIGKYTGVGGHIFMKDSV